MTGTSAPACLLVYGTLQRGERNHHLIAGAHYLAPAETAEAAFTLCVYGSVSTPGRVTPAISRGGTWRIGGEVYALDQDLLAVLDRFERVGLDYDREDVPLASGGTAWLYLHRRTAQRQPLADAPGRILADGCATWRDPLPPASA